MAMRASEWKFSKEELQMRDMSYNWRFLADPNTRASIERYGSDGKIYDDAGNDLAYYCASLATWKGQKRVSLYICLLAKNLKNKKRKKNTVLLDIWRQEGEVMTRDASDLDVVCIFPNHPLSREEALKSPPTPLFSEIKDFILENDPYILPFLDDDCTPET